MCKLKDPFQKSEILCEVNFKLHPGGAEWIEMTEGQDISEAFEAAHIRGRLADAIAKKYFVRKIDKPRNSVTTFEEKGWFIHCKYF